LIEPNPKEKIMTTKFYARRDSATSLLRKMGVHTRDYAAFIKNVDGGVELDVSAAEAHAAKIKEMASGQTLVKKDPPKAKVEKTVEKSTKAGKPAKAAAKTEKAVRRTVSSVARELILAGKTNDEVWKALQSEFQLADSKKGYPCWYRADLRKKGLLK